MVDSEEARHWQALAEEFGLTPEPAESALAAREKPAEDRPAKPAREREFRQPDVPAEPAAARVPAPPEDDRPAMPAEAPSKALLQTRDDEESSPRKERRPPRVRAPGDKPKGGPRKSGGARNDKPREGGQPREGGRGRGRDRGPRKSTPPPEETTPAKEWAAAQIPESDSDADEEISSTWNNSSWQELISSLYRPER